MMARVSFILLIILAVMVGVVVNAQVTPLPERTVGLQIERGEGGRFYVFCTQGCERLLTVATVEEIYADFPTNTDAHNHGLILMARLNPGSVPVLLPGTSYTPTP